MSDIMSNLGLRDIPLEKSEEESLGISDYILSLGDFIQQCETPMTIALQGDWGSGKTSMMNLIKRNIEEKNKNIHTIWFNTWQFSQFGMEDDLSISLLSSFLEKLGTDAETKKKLLGGITRKKFANILSFGAEKAGGGVGAGVGMLAKVVNGSEQDEDVDIAHQIVKLKEGIEKSVKDKIGNDDNKRLVLFIDDLDRLLPEKAVELLEVFKLFMDVPGCVYVLACDYQVVSQGLKKKFGVGSDELKGKSFFDKIIQLPFSMPLGQYKIDNYIEGLLKKIKFKCEPDDINSYVEMVTYSVGFNPRTMKRLFNSLLLLKLVADKKNLFDDSDGVATKTEKQRILFGALCLQTAYEPVYRYFQKNEDKINQAFFEGLKNEEMLQADIRFEEIRKELNSDKDISVLRKLSKFMDVFFESVQLQSDDDKATLSEKEVETLKNIISFSSLTSTEASSAKENVDSTNRYRNRDMAKIFTGELNNKYNESLEKLGKDTLFALYQGRQSSDAHIYFRPKTDPSIGYNFNVSFGNDVKLAFENKKDGEKIDYISLNIFCFNVNTKNKMKEWFDKNCSDIFPNMYSTPGNLVLIKEEFEPGTSFKEREDKFKKMAFKYLDILFPKLVNSFGTSPETK